MSQSKLVTFIGGFYIFGGIVILISLFLGGSAINIRFGLSDVPDYIVKIIVGVAAIGIGFLFMKRTQMSWYFMLIYSIVFFSISAALTTKYGTQPYVGNMIYSVFVFTVAVMKRKEFVNSIKSIL